MSTSTFESGNTYGQPLYTGVRVWFGDEEINIPRNNLISFNCSVKEGGTVQFKMTLFDINYIDLEQKWENVRGEHKIAFQIYQTDDRGVFKTSDKWKSIALSKWEPVFSNDGISLTIEGVSKIVVDEMVRRKFVTKGTLHKQLKYIIQLGIREKIWRLQSNSAYIKLSRCLSKVSTNNDSGHELSYKHHIVNGGLLSVLNQLISHAVTPDGERFSAYVENKGHAIPTLYIVSNKEFKKKRTYTYFHNQPKKTDIIEWSPDIKSLVDLLVVDGAGASNISDPSATENTITDKVFKKITEDVIKNKVEKVFDTKMSFDTQVKTLEDSIRGKSKLHEDYNGDMSYNNNVNNFAKKSMLYNTAKLKIYGDYDITIGDGIRVKCLMTKKNPDGTINSLGEHYSSGNFMVTGVSHDIQMGTFTTELSLVKLENVKVEKEERKRTQDGKDVNEVKKD